ncbi:MAG: response regulator [Alphaproteobacteria bacterium]|jgi:two-component system phosphate regulon response regulator OmpR|nr:response regulator [Alphaproteobacteria bacterium]
MNRTPILVVEDEAEVREMIADYLEAHGFAVLQAADAAAAEARLNEAELVLLDVNMPGESGVSFARRLQARTPRKPLIFVTAIGDTIDRVVGLELGADDYVAKPFDPRELVARIRAVLRRAATAPQPAATRSDLVTMGRCRLDLPACRLTGPDGEPVPLTAMEFDLLSAFARHPNRALSRDQLLDLAHRREAEPFDRSIDIRITRLRRKIEADPAHPQAIRTVRGIGYMFVPG